MQTEENTTKAGARTQEKAIEWAYPTSPDASKFKFKSGCFTVSIIDTKKCKSASVGGFKTLAEAEEFANGIDLPYSRFTFQNFNK